jgi:hypothetical protein
MNRLGVFSFLLLGPLIVGASPKDAAAPVISFSIYAPVQKESPVHIVGLRYDKLSMQFALSNDSDRSVVDAKIVAVAAAPPGCPTDPNRSDLNTDLRIGADNVPQVIIGPHQSVTFPREHGFIVPVLPPQILVDNARHLAASYLNVQVEVVEVDFANGTKWTRHERDDERPYGIYLPFDPLLVDADARKCADVADAIRALNTTDGVRFDRRVEKPSYGDDGVSTPSRLFFSCRLEDSKVVCPLP